MTQPPLTDVAYLKQVLAKADISPKRSLGQNFLVCPEVVEATVTTLSQGPGNVTELGAGLGTLTQAVTAAGFSVRAIEKDDALVKMLVKHVGKQVEVIHGDIKDTDWRWSDNNVTPGLTRGPAHNAQTLDSGSGSGMTGRAPYQIIGNIPYNLSGLIIRRLTQLEPAPSQALLLVQTEVGERMLATPPDMSLLSLAVQLWGQAHHVLTVPQSCFWPQPKVTSSLIALIPHAQPNPDQENIMQLAKICFQAKRKQIGGSLKRSQEYSTAAVTDALQAAHISPQTRPQELSATAWHSLYQELSART